MRRAIALCSFVVLMLAVPLAAVAAPGDLDSTFSGDGMNTTDFGGSDEGHGLARTASGGVYLAGETEFKGDPDFAVARYNANGTLSSSFSGDGRQTIDFLGFNDEAWGVAVQPDAKPILAGSAENSSGGNAFAVARLTGAGALDPAFSGDGKVRTTFPGAFDTYAYTPLIQEDGKIVVAGEADMSEETTDWNFAVARYKPNGTLDPTFSGDGRVLIDFSGGTDGAWDAALQDDGKIVLVGWTRGPNKGDSYDFAIVRLRTNGTLDTSFSGDGKRVINLAPGEDDYAYSVAIRPDGKLVVGGPIEATGAVGLLRLNTGGGNDSTFTGDGKTVVDPFEGSGFFEDLTLDASNRIYATFDAANQFGLARILAGGALDPAFGDDGTTLSAFAGDSYPAEVVVLQSGRIVIGGRTAGSDFAVARFLP